MVVNLCTVGSLWSALCVDNCDPHEVALKVSVNHSGAGQNNV